MTNIDKIALQADVILGGYAVIRNGNGSCTIGNKRAHSRRSRGLYPRNGKII